jgi:hypothetical protein
MEALMVFLPPEPTGTVCRDPLHRGCKAVIEPPATCCEPCLKAWDFDWKTEMGILPPTVEDRIEQSGIPPLLRGYTWEGCKMPEEITGDLRALVRDLRAEPGRPPIALLWGSVGAGKSAWAACLLMRTIRKGHAGLWVDVPSWLRTVTSMEEYSQRDIEIDRVTRWRGLVVLDELLPRQVTDHQADIVFRLINGRTTHLRPTLCTTNHPIRSDLDERTICGAYGDRVASRIGQGVVLEWRGPDRRLAAT